MLKTKKISELYNMKVFTDDGSYFGDIEECTLSGNRVHGWRIRATKGSALTKILGGAKGVVIPHQLVKAVSDVVVISKAAIPSFDEEHAE